MIVNQKKSIKCFAWWIANLTKINICFSFGILPHRRPINVVIGSPIEITNSVKNPTDEEVSDFFAHM